MRVRRSDVTVMPTRMLAEYTSRRRRPMMSVEEAWALHGRLAGALGWLLSWSRAPQARWAYAGVIDPLTSPDSSLVELVESVQATKRWQRRGMLRERHGTFSTKHLFLAEALGERFPETEPQIVHRVYRLDQKAARELFGERVADAVPEEGLVDLHRYLTAVVEGRRIVIDATFPGEPWDGLSPMPLACGPGRDYPVGADPDGEKRAL